MSKETKFGYGFLLAGVGLPYLIEKLAGPFTALVIAVACTVLGASLLLAGHLHRDREIASPGKISLVIRSIKYGVMVVIIFGLIAGISRLGWLLMKRHEGNMTPSTETASSVPTPVPAPPKASTKISDKASRSPYEVERYDLNSITEAIWFGIYVQASVSLKKQFRSMDQAALQIYGGAYSVNTIDNLPAEAYETAWQSTFGKVLMCNPESGISSTMDFALSQHPSISVSISNNSLSDHKCEMKGHINRPIMTGDIGFVLTGPSGRRPRHAYILDVPITRDVFTVRFFMNGTELKQLTEGYSPPWKSFAIDNAKEVLRLQIYRKGAVQWVGLPQIEQFLPDRITLKTDLLYGGPKIVREYKLISRIPQQIGRGDDASQIFIWAFTWQPVRYAEEHSEFSGN